MPKIAKQLSPLEVGRLNVPGLVAVGGVPGLCLQIAPSGARSWILRVTVGLKRRDMGLGAFPAVPLAKAYEKARSAREKIDKGIDPILTRDRARSQLLAEQAKAVTFQEAAGYFIDVKAAEWSNKKHLEQWTNTLKTYAFPVIGALHVQDVQDAHIMKILEPIWRTKTETATRIRNRIENVLDWATAKKYRTGVNPARWRGHLDKLLPAPRKTTPVEHHKAIPLDSAPGFYAALRLREGVAVRALEFLLLTAARSGEIRGATWAEFDQDKKVWTVPALRMKMKKEHRVPMNESTIRILNALPKMEGSEFVFPGLRGKELSDMTLSAVMRRMEVNAVPHGLRSTFRDWAAERSNFPSEMAEIALAHRVANNVEAAYRRGDMFEKRRAMMSAWADFLTASLLETETAVAVDDH